MKIFQKVKNRYKKLFQSLPLSVRRLLKKGKRIFYNRSKKGYTSYKHDVWVHMGIDHKTGYEKRVNLTTKEERFYRFGVRVGIRHFGNFRPIAKLGGTR